MHNKNVVLNTAFWKNTILSYFPCIFIIKNQGSTYLVEDENGLGDPAVPDWEANDLSSLFFIILFDVQPAVLHLSSSSLTY